ncbi:MAG: hypothetical protein JXR52_08660 [Bacteroidales bacterium]|nr:hypothetical protein [Bacteroidales bacterium]MBN2698883.1 hypothetical protein [Bacteroidales bacterium]
MNFRTGQKVICVNDRFNRKPVHAVKAGEIYYINGFYSCPSCQSLQFSLFEFPFYTLMGCKCGLTLERRQTFYAWRFVPLDEAEIEEKREEKAITIS